MPSYKDRVLKALKFLNIIRPGSIFYVHFSIVNFGHEKKPFHYFFCLDQFNPNFSFFRSLPGTSKKNSASFKVNLLEESSINETEVEDITTFILLKRITFIKYIDVANPEKKITHRGYLDNSKFRELLKAKQDFIANQHKRSINER